MNEVNIKEIIKEWPTRKKIGQMPERLWICPKCQKFEGTLEEVQEHQSKCLAPN